MDGHLNFYYAYSMDVEGDYEPHDADGFIKIHALRLREFRRLQTVLK